MSDDAVAPDLPADLPPERELSIATLPSLLDRVRSALREHREEIDDLNVFPVPDGDTGTNLVLTASAIADELVGVDPADGDAVATAVIRGALMGARGNSGVIASQVFRGFAEVLRDGGTGTIALADALGRARVLAYEAVAQPVEGTILTAITRAADAALACRSRGSALPEAVGEVLAATHAAVVRTTEQLEVLRAAGVVDAGARGFEVMLEALHAHATGRAFTRAEDPADDAALEPVWHAPEAPAGPHGQLTFRFEVQYLLEAEADGAAHLRSRLERIGDSVVVTAAAGMMNVHVHTDDVGLAIEEGLALGRPSRIEVTYFPEQIAEHDAEVLRRHAEGTQPPAQRADLGTIGAVAVLPGGALRDLAQEFHAAVVEGAAGSLPSVATLLNAVGDVAAERIVLLPGHPNVVPTTRMAVEVAVAEGGRVLDIVEAATSPPSVLAALSVCDPTLDADAVLEQMRAAAEACRSGEVVHAVRDARTPAGNVDKGQALGVVDGDVVAIEDDPIAALVEVGQHLDLGAAEVVTLIVGADVDDAERDRALAALEAVAPDAEFEVIDGGMRPVRYFLGAE